MNEKQGPKIRPVIFIITFICLFVSCLTLVAGFFFFSVLSSTDLPNLNSARSSHYWTHGCITFDQKKLGAVGDQAALVDLETGQISEKIVAYFEDVVCFSNNQIIGLSHNGLYSVKEGVWTDTETEAGDLGQLGGLLSDDRIVTYYRSRDTTSTTRRYYGPLTINIFELGAKDQPGHTIELPPEVFPNSLGEGNISWFETFTAPILDHDQLLVVAGYRPNYSFGKVQSRPWGLFTVDLNSGEVSQLGPLRTGDNIANMYFWDDMAATPNGQIVAVAFRLQPETKRQVVILGLDVDIEEDLFRVTFDGVHEVHQMRLNEPGDLLAVGLSQAAGASIKTAVIDMNTGEILWQIEDSKGRPALLQFLDDDSLVVMTSQRVVARREGRSGELLWENWPDKVQNAEGTNR